MGEPVGPGGEDDVEGVAHELAVLDAEEGRHVADARGLAELDEVGRSVLAEDEVDAEEAELAGPPAVGEGRGAVGRVGRRRAVAAERRVDGGADRGGEEAWAGKG